MSFPAQVLRRAALVLLVLVAACSGGRPSPAAEAARLESHLLAPCCWMQTLDVHRSPLADELRAEIARRLERGEAADAVEADLLARYGERLRAVPDGFEIDHVMWPLVILAAASAFAVAWWAGRHTRPAALAGDPHVGATPARDDAAEALEERLADELRDLD